MTNLPPAARLRILADQLDSKSLSAADSNTLGQELDDLETRIDKWPQRKDLGQMLQDLKKKVTALGRNNGLQIAKLREDVARLQGKALIWSDGSYSPKSKVGGWGAVVEIDGKPKELSGSVSETDISPMEMTAIIEALKVLLPEKPVLITSDDKHLVTTANKWLQGQKHKPNGEPFANQDLWEKLDGLMKTRSTWVSVDGHTGHPENERCDKLANAARTKKETEDKLANAARMKLGKEIGDKGAQKAQEKTEQEKAEQVDQVKQREDQARLQGKALIWGNGIYSPKSKVGGWGAVVEIDGKPKEFSDKDRNTNISRLKMTAIIKALEAIPAEKPVLVTCKDKTLVETANKWQRGQKCRANGKPLSNPDLWEKLDGLMKTRSTWVSVPKHVDHPKNKRCAELAKAALMKREPDPE